MQDTLDIAGAD